MRRDAGEPRLAHPSQGIPMAYIQKQRGKYRVRQLQTSCCYDFTVIAIRRDRPGGMGHLDMAAVGGRRSPITVLRALSAGQHGRFTMTMIWRRGEDDSARRSVRCFLESE